MQSPRQERRGKPRVEAGLAVQFADEEGLSGVAAETVNLSTAGVCCRTACAVELLTTVRITLLVPETQGRKKAKTAVVHAEGVVVRCEGVISDEGSPEFEVACSFTLLGAKDRRILESYVDNQLPASDPKGNSRRWQGAGLKTRQ